MLCFLIHFNLKAIYRLVYLLKLALSDFECSQKITINFDYKQLIYKNLYSFCIAKLTAKPWPQLKLISCHLVDIKLKRSQA